MRILFCGDVMGQAGRKALARHVPVLKSTHKLDVVIANAENAAHGFGLTHKIAVELQSYGVDVLTTGNHVWDQREFLRDIAGLPQVVRPLNYPAGTPGSGVYVGTVGSGNAKIAVLNVMGRLFMDALDDPFAAVDKALAALTMGGSIRAIVLDVHGEASSEKQALACHVDGRVSLVVGTHTHVPTADARLLPNGTAYMTDAGMCGDYDSIIGMKKEQALPKLRSKLPGERLQPAEGEATLCGVIVETHPLTGLAVTIQPIRVGGVLHSTH